jgi:glycosyltransferase involved in cell wall biosynthesis
VKIGILVSDKNEGNRPTGILRVIKSFSSVQQEGGVELIPVLLDKNGVFHTQVKFSLKIRSHKISILHELKKILRKWDVDPKFKFLLIINDYYNFKILKKYQGNKIELDFLIIPKFQTNHYVIKALERNSLRSKTKFVLICHDVFPFTDPNWFTAVAQLKKNYMLKTMKLANFISCVSEYTKNQYNYLAKMYSIENEAIFVNSLGCKYAKAGSRNINGVETSGVLKILYVSSIEPRKNHRFLIDCLSKLATKKVIELHLVYGDTWKSAKLLKQIKACHHNNFEIKLHEAASEEELQFLYQSVDFTVYISKNEGYGLPILESLAFGTPVVASDIDVFKEFVNIGGIYYVSNSSELEFIEQIEKIINTPNLLLKLKSQINFDLIRSEREANNELIEKITSNAAKNLNESH